MRERLADAVLTLLPLETKEFQDTDAKDAFDRIMRDLTPDYTSKLQMTRPSTSQEKYSSCIAGWCN